jgi:integrase
MQPYSSTFGAIQTHGYQATFWKVCGWTTALCVQIVRLTRPRSRIHFWSVPPELRQSAKSRQLAAFVKWLGKDTELSTITRKVTGRYAAEVVHPAQRATKTRKDWLANLTAFGSWCKQYGLTESNPGRNLTRTFKESTRGGRPRPRPFTEGELDALVRSLPKGSPLLPLACLGAYSGARLEELCSMKVEHVTDDALRVMEGKNENSVRFIPIHKTLRPMVKRLP